MEPAKELCALLSTDKAINGAEKMASLYKYYSLVDYLDQLKQERSKAQMPQTPSSSDLLNKLN